MSEQTNLHRICPYLGFNNDPHARFAYPDSAHRCFASGQGTPVPAEHQSAFCLSRRYPTCPRFVDMPAEAVTTQVNHADIVSPSGKNSLSKSVLLGAVGLMIGLLMISGLYYLSLPPHNPDVPTGEEMGQDLSGSMATPPNGLTLNEDIIITSTAVPVTDTPAPTSTPTPDPNLQIYELPASAGDIGWVTNVEERGNHFGDSYLYAGILNGEVYNGAFLFDLSRIPRGAPIEYAAIQMTGLRDDHLAIKTDKSDAAGVWTLRLLADDGDKEWRRQNFQNVFNAPALQTLAPLLSSQDLLVGKTNLFELTPAQITILEERIIDKENPTLSFRVEGPLVGPDNLFAWDTGYGPKSTGHAVKLILRAGPPPTVPPAYDFILVTSTPTPDNVMTAAAVALQLTADATSVGTVTPLPPNAVTTTPYPDYLVLVDTPVPGNQQTAQAVIEAATAIALTTGTATSIPTNAVTATPTPTETSTPVPTPIKYVLITSTPTPDSVFAAATQSLQATALAMQIGTATPLPFEWVTPVVVTVTPTPLNQATAQAIADLAAAIALTTGTPTAIPSNMVTATSTPVFEIIPLILPLTSVTPTPIPPDSMPAELLGKVLFRSDRENTGEGESLFVYVYDPVTGELGRLTADWPYQMAHERDAFSADTIFRAYVKQLLWTNRVDKTITEIIEDNGLGTPVVRLDIDKIYTPTEEFAIHRYDYKYHQEDIVTRMGTGITYDPAWSPVNNEIAFVADESQNDEIWVINSDGTGARQLTKNTWEWDKSPSWSPDGQQIVFASNRTGNLQLWIMNADGSDQKLLMGWDNWTPYNDWAPVWVKYSDPAPPEEMQR